MLSAFSSIALGYETIFLLLAILILVLGSTMAMRLYARVRRTQGKLKVLWLSLCGLLAGGTVWSTQFVFAMAYQNPLMLGYQAELIGASFFIAVFGTTLGFYVASLTQRSILIEAGGLIFGLSIAAMHFVGMKAMIVTGVAVHSSSYVAASILCAVFFGILATNRIARPVTRFCKHGSSLSFFLAVASMHFIAMSGFHIFEMRLNPDLERLVSNQTIGLTVIFMMVLLFIVGLLVHSIDTATTEAAASNFNRMINRDPLTGLPNQQGLDSRLNAMLSRAESGNSKIVVFSFSLSELQEISAAVDQKTSDDALRQVAHQLSKNLEGSETCAHLGKGHFLVVGKSFYRDSNISNLASKIKDICRLSVMNYRISGIKADFPIGYALYPDHGYSSKELISAAEKAMRRAKIEGCRELQGYDPKNDEKLRERSSLTIALMQAVKNQEFELHYQRQNNAITRELTGAEVLVRWRHPERGMISPAEFIPLAEEQNLIGEIGEWVLYQACCDAAAWKNPLKIAVNVSSIQLSDNGFPDKVFEILQSTGLDPARLELEITETGIIADTQHALQMIQQLKSRGIRIAMDDFGTGYSSLSTLQTFPFDKIKIDREFVKDLDTQPQSEAIITATCVLAESLNIPVLAEGVETEHQLETLSRLGCVEVQGFLFGKPIPLSEFHEVHILENTDDTDRDLEARFAEELNPAKQVA